MFDHTYLGEYICYFTSIRVLWRIFHSWHIFPTHIKNSLNCQAGAHMHLWLCIMNTIFSSREEIIKRFKLQRLCVFETFQFTCLWREIRAAFNIKGGFVTIPLQYIKTKHISEGFCNTGRTFFTLLMLEPDHGGRNKSVLLLHMPWPLVSPDHQPQCYWLCMINGYLSSLDCLSSVLPISMSKKTK